MTDTATASTAEGTDTQLQQALDLASRNTAADRLSADSEHKPDTAKPSLDTSKGAEAGGVANDGAVKAKDQGPARTELEMLPGRPPAGTDASSSRLSDLQNGTVGPDLAKLFKWLPPIGSENNPECRLGNRLHDYFNASSEAKRAQALEQLKKEAMEQGSPKALDLLRTTATFDAAVTAIDAKKGMAEGVTGSIDREQRALTDLAALANAGCTAAGVILEKETGRDSKWFLDQAAREVSLRAEAVAGPVSDLATDAAEAAQDAGKEKGKGARDGSKDGSKDRLNDRSAGTVSDTDNGIKKNSNEGNEDTAANALERQSYMLGEKSVLHVKRWADAAGAVKDSGSPDQAALAIVKLSNLSASGNPEAKQIFSELVKSGAVPDLSLICNDRAQLTAELKDPAVLARLQQQLKPTQDALIDLAHLNPSQVLGFFGVQHTPSDAAPAASPPPVAGMRSRTDVSNAPNPVNMPANTGDTGGTGGAPFAAGGTPFAAGGGPFAPGSDTSTAFSKVPYLAGAARTEGGVGTTGEGASTSIADAQIEQERQNIYRHLNNRDDSRNTLQRMACAGKDGQHPTEAWRAAREVFGNDNTAAGMVFDQRDNQLNDASLRFMIGNASQRQAALKSLEDWSMQGDQSAQVLLNRLAMVDAVSRLRSAKTDDDQRKALRDLASLELASADQEKAKGLLDHFPNAVDSANARPVSKEERQQMVEQVRREVREEKVGITSRTNELIVQAASGTAEQRQKAMDSLEKTLRNQTRYSGDQWAANDAFQKLTLENAVVDILHTNDPQKVSDDLVKIMEMAEVGKLREPAQNILDQLLRVTDPADQAGQDGNYRSSSQDSQKSQDGGIGSLIEKLADHDHAAEAVAQIKAALQPIAEGQDHSQKTPTVILDEFKGKEQVQQERENARKLESENWKRADDAVGRFLDRNARPEDRAKAVEDLKSESQSCLRQFRSTKYNPVLGEAEGVNAALNVRDSVSQAIKSENADGLPDGQARTKVLETLKQLQLKSQENSGYGAYAFADRALGKIGSPEEVKALTAKLESGAASQQAEALKTIQSKLEDLPHDLDRLRTGHILADIGEKSTPAQFAEAAKKLSDEAAAGNKVAQDWKPWTMSAAIVSSINSATTPEKVREAVTNLVSEAFGGNPYARQELAGMLIANGQEDQARKWMLSGNAELNGHPIFVPELNKDLLKANPNLLSELKERAALELTSEIKLSEDKLAHKVEGAEGAPLSKGKAFAMSLALADANATNDYHLRDLLKPALITARTGHGAAEVEEGLYQAILANGKNSGTLAKFYLEGVDGPSFQKHFNDLSTEAYLGKDAAMLVMAGAIAGGVGKNVNQELIDNAQNCFDSILYKEHSTDCAVHGLLTMYNQLGPDGDRGKLLANLGRMADKIDAPLADDVRAALARGLTSTHPVERASAVQGMVALADKWQAKDAQLLLDHLDTSLPKALREGLDHIPPAYQKQLAEGLSKYIDPNASSTSQERLAAIQSLAILAKDTTPVQLALLEKYGDANLKNFAGDKLNEKEIDQLRTAAGHTLIAVIGKSERCRKQAFESFSKVDWPHIDDNPEQYKLLKATLKDYAQGNPFDLESFEKINSMVYDSGLPRPIAGVLKNWGVPAANNEELFSKAQLCTKKAEGLIPGLSGDETVRRIAQNIDLLNTLTPDVRHDLGLPFAERINAQQVAGILQGGNLKDSRFAFLLENWPEKATAMRNDLAVQSRNAADTVNHLEHGTRCDVLDQLAEHTKKGVSIMDRLGYVALPALTDGLVTDDSIDRFDERQSQLVQKLRETDAAIKSARTAQAGIESTFAVVDLATKVGEHTQLKNSGQQRQADELAAGDLFRQHGNMIKQFAPSVWSDLTPSGDGRTGRSAFKRLNQAGEAPYLELPQINNMDQALSVLKDLSRHSYADGEKAVGWQEREGVEKAALSAIDGSKNLSQLSKTAGEIGPHLDSLSKLFQASAEGTKYDDLVNLMKSDSHEIRAAMAGFDTSALGDIRSDIGKIEETLKDQNLAGQARADLEQRLQSYKGMADLMDPGSSKHKQVMEMLDKIDDPNFNSDTFCNWAKKNGPVLAATVVAVAATVAACASCGVASPLAVAAWCSVSALAASEITKESLYQINSNGYTGWGTYGERSLVGKWSEDIDKRSLMENIVSFDRDVLLPYEKQIVIDTALAFATMGISKFVMGGTSAFTGPAVREMIFGNPAATQLAAQLERVGVEAGAQTASGQFMRQFMQKFGQELLINTGMTGAQVSASELANSIMPEYMREGGETFSFGLSTVLAIGQANLHLHMQPGAGRTMHYEGDTAALEKFYASEGHKVRDLGAGRFEVIPFDARPGAPAFVLERGIALPPADVFPAGRGPEGNLHASPRPEPTNQIGRDAQAFSDQFMQGKFDGAAKTAGASLEQISSEIKFKPIEVDCQSLVNAPAGSDALPRLLSEMGDYGRATNEGGKLSASLPKPLLKIAPDCHVSALDPTHTADGKPLTAEQQKKVNDFLQSKPGQRIMAEQAVISMEENLHLHALKEPGSTSPSFERFRQAAGTSGERTADSFEQEAILALHDADPKRWDSEMLRRHFGQQHAEAREPVFKWIEQQEGKTPASPAGENKTAASPANENKTPGSPTGEGEGRPGGETKTVPADKAVAPQEQTDLHRQDPKLSRPARIKELIEEGSTTFESREADNKKLGQAAQQAIFKGLEKALNGSKPGQPSLADRGWEIIQSHKNSAGDQAKMDFILINKNTGDYHLIDATADPTKFDRVKRSAILTDAVIMLDPRADLDFGQLTDRGMAKVVDKLDFLSNKKSPLNIDSYPPPTLESPNSMDGAARQMEEFRSKLISSGNKDLQDYGRALQGGLAELNRRDIERTPEWQTKNAVVQKNVDGLVERAMRDLINGKQAPNKDIDLDRIKPDRKAGSKFDMDLGDNGKFRVERDGNNLDKQFDRVFKKMIESAQNDPARQAEMIRAKNKYSPEEVMRRVQILASECKPKALMADSSAPAAPKFDKFSATLDLLVGECKKYGVMPEPQRGYSGEVKDAMRLAYDELGESIKTANPADKIKLEATSDVLRKMIDAYNPDNVERVNSINTSLTNSMGMEGKAPANISLGRNEESLVTAKKAIAESTMGDGAKSRLTAMAEGGPRGESLARKVTSLPEAVRKEAGLDGAIGRGADQDDLVLRAKFAETLSRLDAIDIAEKRGLETLLQRSKVKDGANINENRLRLTEKILAMSPEEQEKNGIKWLLEQPRLDIQSLREMVAQAEKSQRSATPVGLQYESVPELNLAESRDLMAKAVQDAGGKPVNLLDMLKNHDFGRGSRDGADLAAALEQSEFFSKFKDSISSAEIIGEGNESVVIKVKGPFVVGEGSDKVTLPEMALKISQPLRGEWDEEWGDWRERPWDALMVNPESVRVDNLGKHYEIYLQELVVPGISDGDQARMEAMISNWNEAKNATRNDTYEVWDTDGRGRANKQFGYSSLPVSASAENGLGNVWTTVNGKKMRVVVVDPWTVCKVGEDGLKE